MFRWTDYEMVPKPQSDFERIFGKRREYTIRKAQYRGGTGSRLHMIQNLSREEAVHFLLHDRFGRQMQRDFPNIPFDQLADHLVTASRRPTEKREVSKMDNDLKVIAKSESAMHALCKHLAASSGTGFSHPQFDDLLARYSANKHPALRLGNAIAKVLAEETPVARAYSAVHSFYKAQPVVDDDDDDDDDDDEDGTDAMQELERLAEEQRRRENGMGKQMTKEQAFTKVLLDPENVELAKRERRQNRPR